MSTLGPLMPSSIAVFLLMLVRVGTMLMLLPGFNGRGVPVPAKIGFSVVLTLILVPVSPAGDPALSDAGRFVVGVGQEFLVGLLFGFAVALVFAAIEMAAGIINMQMGHNLAASFNPTFNTTGAALDTL
jgi:flagellar biosynthetic protein FliR